MISFYSRQIGLILTVSFDYVLMGVLMTFWFMCLERKLWVLMMVIRMRLVLPYVLQISLFESWCVTEYWEQ